MLVCVCVSFEITECGQLRLQSKAGRRFGGAAVVADWRRLKNLR